MESNEKCSIGKHLNEDCHLDSFTRVHFLKNLESLTGDELKILLLRLPTFTPDLKETHHQKICNHHYCRFLVYYSGSRRKCIDPWNIHKIIVKGGLREIQLELSEISKSACNINLIPGQKICINCFAKLKKEIDEYNFQFNYCVDPFQRHRNKRINELQFLNQNFIEYFEQVLNLKLTVQHKICSACKIQVESNISELVKLKGETLLPVDGTESNGSLNNDSQSLTSRENTPSSVSETNSQKKKKFDEILTTYNIPPFKRMKLSDERVVKKGIEYIQTVVNETSSSFEQAYDIELPVLKNLNQIYKESSWFKSILSNIKTKLDTCKSFNEKVSLLTLLPNDWSFEIVKEHLQCTYHTFNEARKLRENHGILEQRVRKSYLRISVEIRNEIIEYYLNDSNTIMCSGAKECVTIKVPGQPSLTAQKKILIYDLCDLYKNWIRDSNRKDVPCLAFFSSLKPKQCVFAGDPGTHNICVCPIHENIRLKLAAVLPSLNYIQMIEVAVCSLANKLCMFNECGECPKKSGVEKFLRTNIATENIENVKYSNWASVTVNTGNTEISTSTRVTLTNFTEPIDEFLDKLSENIWDMTRHHFISYKQKEYLNEMLENLDSDTGLLIMDFAENYAFICQNSTQGFYFNNSNATLFTATFYYKEQVAMDLKVASFCVISETSIHQAYSVNVFMKTVIDDIKSRFLWITKIIYFSDGAPTQFKNKNHFGNLCFHEEEFGLKIVSYNFFATSHGKSACDGIGAAVKRIARKASKQGVQILNAQQMYVYLSTKESNIRIMYVEDSKVVARGKSLAKRFASAKTVKDTRHYHYFEPVDQKTMKVKFYSSDEESFIVNIFN